LNLSRQLTPFPPRKARRLWAILLFFLLATMAPARAADVPLSPASAPEERAGAAVRLTDDRRVTATVTADLKTLATILSDDLRYAHSSGLVDTKVSFLGALACGRAKYLSIAYEERTFKLVAPGLVLMAGRGHFQVARNGQAEDLHLGFLGVWRQEQGTWHLLAWQSCRLPPPAPAK
jgi:hypothetical protein